MLRKLSLALSLAAVTAVGGASAASAAVTFDPATGSGFVGKGDVQYTFGWNNAKLQSNAGTVDFRYESAQDYEVICEFDTEQGGRDGVRSVVQHVARQELASSLSRDVTTVTRKNSQGDVNGFKLSAEGDAIVIGGALPEVGGECKSGKGNSFNDRITSVVPVGEATGGLLVKWGSVAYTPLLSPAV